MNNGENSSWIDVPPDLDKSSIPMDLNRRVTGVKSKVRLVNAGLADILAVAAYFVRLAENEEEEPDYLTHMRLQKLMYYAQAWSLAMRRRPLFDGRIEAWAHGPVVRDLYSCLAKYGRQPIPPDALSESNDLTEEQRRFVASVWEAYKGFTAFSLRSMTHNEAPWINARGGASPTESCDSEITHEAMLAFFCK